MAGIDERAYIVQGFKDDLRNDGRSCRQMRRMSISLGVLPQCSGSARCCVGSTEVLVGVKAELGTPHPETPELGGVQVSVECSPCAGPSYQNRAGEELAAELAKRMEQSLKATPSGRGSTLDLRALSVVAGKTCWVLCIDALLVSLDGSLLDALSIAIRAALQNTRIPLVEVGDVANGDEEPELELDDDLAHAKPVDMRRVPIIVTASKAGQAYVLNADAEEEQCLESAIHLAVNAQGSVCGLFKRGPGALNPAVLQELMMLAQQQGPAVIRAVDRHCETAATCMEE